MYPHPQLNSYLNGLSLQTSKIIVNRTVYKALQEKYTRGGRNSEFLRVTSIQPQCFAPHVDVTRAKCGFKQFALPKLNMELGSDDPLIVRQALTTLTDLLCYPEKLSEAIQLNIPNSLTDFLVSNDPYLRERVAMAYATIANQVSGKEAILKNLTTVANLSRGLDDSLAAVRLQVARVLEALANNNSAADKLCIYGFVKAISGKLTNERKDILIIYLSILELLFHRNSKAAAIKNGSFDEIVALLSRKDEILLCKSLSCLRVLCEDLSGKQKALELDLLVKLKELLTDKREYVNLEAARVMSFITITSRGKLRLLELRMPSFLLLTLTQKCCPSQELILTNVAEAPEGRRMLLKYESLIENIAVGKNQVLQRHRQTLLDVVRWRP
ncbi:PREDICTED: uncharacterized protein LOC105364838 [Ceratosolen solmsi marchali]|uniref:Uncharacterized protein LOC105364838 n=1 Tax=Ceratosolen solmsi marchali TaxID=326594 RepID=A0AAJ6YNA4_9HYME|nr:PREDICTED: uncharacterized protein LOC105364838 [Ceratosolen solmsi marchali]